MQQQSQEPVSTLLYRIESMEKDITFLKSQLSLYEPTRENNLKLQRINDTVGRIELELSKIKDKLEAVSTNMVTQEVESQRRDAASKESLSKLQIRVLWGIVSTVIAALLLLLGAYITHLFG